MFDTLTDEQWQQYETQGYLRLGKVLSDEELATLQQRMDDIMLGRAPLDYDRMLMQLDREPGTGKWDRRPRGTRAPPSATARFRIWSSTHFSWPICENRSFVIFAIASTERIPTLRVFERCS